MIKSYPGFGPVFLISLLIIIGTWMCINPLLETNSDAVPNYGGLLFTAIGIGLLFSLKTITLTGDEILIKQILTGKETLIEKDKISLITIFQDSRSYVEKHFTFHGRAKIKFQFHDKTLDELNLSYIRNTSFYSIIDFLRENYTELTNEQEFL